MPSYIVEMTDETSTHCACCGQVSRSVWGFIDEGDRTVAAYWVRWTKAHLAEHGADFDLVTGALG